MRTSDLDLSRPLRSLRVCRRVLRQASFWLLLVGALVCLVYVSRLYRSVQAARGGGEGGEGGGLQPPLPGEGVRTELERLLAREEEPELPRDQEPVTSVHYLWCDVSFFDFRHYLVLKGAVRALRPERVMLHYTRLPHQDPDGYYSWFQHCQAELLQLVTVPLHLSRCPPPGAARYLLAMELLHRYGGVYVPPLALLVTVPPSLRSLPLASGVLAPPPPGGQDGLVQDASPPHYTDGLILAHRRSFSLPNNSQQLLETLRSAQQWRLTPCLDVPEFNAARRDDVICVKLDEQFYPRDIWTSHDRVAVLARMVAYGVTEIKPRRDVTRHVPRVAHVICPGACALPFSAFLSLLSAVHVGGVSRVYLHGETTPQGRWWRKLQNDTRYVHVYRELPESSEQHALPLLASNLLLKYGGVYQSLDVLWVRPLPAELWEGEAVLALDRRQRGAWPEGVSLQLLLARRGAPFVHRLHAALHSQAHSRGALPARYLAYRLLELQPHTALLEPRLLVECQGRQCHPGWEAGHQVEPHDSSHVMAGEGEEGAWLEQALAVHVTTLGDLDPDALKYSAGQAVLLARLVLQRAGVDLQLL